MSEPRFTHDCRACNFLGHGHLSGQPVDWYTCSVLKGSGARTVIARFGNDGPEYASGTIGETVEPSPVVLAALAHGLDLNEVERTALLRTLLSNHRQRLGVSFWARCAPTDEGHNQIGQANWLGLEDGT
jgi:hypothetical protein